MKRIHVILANVLAVIAIGTGIYFLHDTTPPCLPEPLRYSTVKGFPERVNLLQDIREAQRLLEGKQAGFRFFWVKTKKGFTGKGKKKRPRFVMVRHLDFNVLLAVQRDGGPIEFVSIKKDGTTESDFEIEAERLNGLNTPYVVSLPPGYRMLALRRVARIGKEYKEVVYTPYTSSIDTPALRCEGLKYLRDNIAAARKDLASRMVISLAFGGQVADLVPEKVALSLSLIEHIDPDRLKKEQIERLAGEVLVIAAANKENAYRYAVSSGAGARGLFQFTRDPYRSIVRLYPRAELISDFVVGTDDHLNAAKAALLLFDSDLATAVAKMGRKYAKQLQGNNGALSEYLASAYNWGSGRTVKARQRFGNQWKDHIPNETKDYLRKLAGVEKIFGLR